MPNRFSANELSSLPNFLSRPRFQRYQETTSSTSLALGLYHWNAQISAAFMFPLHLYEICIRNAAASALRNLIGDYWPIVPRFLRSLPNPKNGFSPKRELENVSCLFSKNSTYYTDKIIAELKFAFWQSLYTKRHDQELWNGQILSLFPNFPTGADPAHARKEIHDATEKVRTLRNRIAHHEPIFFRDLQNDYLTIQRILGYRCTITQEWMTRLQGVSSLLALKPI